MYSPSKSALTKMVNKAEEFFRKYLEEHGDFKPESLRHQKKVIKALKEAGFDDRMIHPIYSVCATNFFPAEMARAEIRKYIEVNPGFDPDGDSDIGQLVKNLEKEGRGDCTIHNYLKILKEESDGKKV
jgi:hypothetical protein